MPQEKPTEFYALLNGVHFVTETKGKYSPTYEIRDKNMRRQLASTYRPFRLEVPTGGSVWEIVYEWNRDAFLTYDEIDDLTKKTKKTEDDD